MAPRLPVHRYSPRQAQPVGRRPSAGSAVTLATLGRAKPGRANLGRANLGRAKSGRANLGRSRRPSRDRRASALSYRCPKPRLIAAWLLLVMAIAGLGARLFHLQILQSDTLAQRAEGQRRIAVMPLISRRPVVDRYNRVVATDRQVYTLYVHPNQFEDSSQAYISEVAAKLAPLVDQDADSLRSQLSSADSGIKLQEGITEDTANRIRRLYLNGLDLSSQRERFYAHAGALAHIIGYVDSDGLGQVGVEQSYEDQLAQPFEATDLIQGGNGAVVSSGVPAELLHRDDLSLKLTIDSRLQQIAYHALQEQVEAYGADKGAVMVMDVRTGALRAMATTPTYDPNQFYNSDLETLKNWVLSDLYEPGSTFKPINVAIALETGYLQPTDIISDEGRIVFGQWTIQNHDYETVGSRGALSVSEVLQYSSNVGMVNIMKRMPREEYYSWLERLGLREETGIDLPSEALSLLKSQEQFTQSPVEAATTAFGQGFSLSAIQLLKLHAAVSNGGTLVTPHVIEGLFDNHDVSQWQPERPAVRRVFSPKTSRAVMSMMEDVVVEGSGEPAQIKNYRIAGKTGTAQKAGAGGYSNSRVTSFVSVLPADNPRYVVLTLIDEPQGEGAYGSTVAAPVAKKVMEALIVMEGLPRQQTD